MGSGKRFSQNFEEQFVDLLAKYKFVVQDQDYLNVICKNKVHYINGSWDKMPCVENMPLNKINLIHYNLIWKPQKADIPYGDEFWKYADKTEFADVLRNIRKNYTAEQYQKEVIPALMKKFGYKSIMEVPKIDKIVIIPSE